MCEPLVAVITGAVTVAEPMLPPKQLLFCCPTKVIVAAPISLTVAVVVAVHPLPSLTVAMYDPDKTLLIVAVAPPLLHV